MAEEEEGGQSQLVSSSRRTRSQVAPDWTAMDELILVNEIAAVEADCLKALSSYQKWKIISENCAAQDVSRSLNQCRRKWDFLLLNYNKVKQWESRSKAASFWSLESQWREKLGLPRNFDHELFIAIGNLVRARGNQSDSDPDSDAEAEEELEKVHLVKEPGSNKRQRQRLTSQEKRARRGLAEENIPGCFAEEQPLKSCAERKPPRSHAENNPIGNSMEETPVGNPVDENPQRRSTKRNSRKGDGEEEKETVSIEEKEQMIALIFRENAERINSIVSENAEINVDCRTESTEFVRHQGDKLISCLGDMVKILDQLCHLVQECE